MSNLFVFFHNLKFEERTVKIISCLLLFVSFTSVSQEKEHKFWERVDPSEHESFATIAKAFRESKILSDSDSLVLVKSKKDDFGILHNVFQQYHNGIPIEGAELIFHSKNGKVILYNGILVSGIKYSFSNPSFSEDKAVEFAKQEIKADKYAWEDNEYLDILREVTNDKISSLYPSPKLCYHQVDKKYELCYKVDVFSIHPHGRCLIFMNAISGEIVKKVEMFQHVTGSCSTVHHGTQNIDFDITPSGTYELTDTSRNIETYVLPSLTTNYALGVIPTSSVLDWSGLASHEQDALDIHWSSEVVYDYLLSIGLTSFDNNGALIRSYSNYGYNNGSSNNAFWNGFFLTYGNGGGATFPNPVSTLDVVAHEIGHAVTENYGNGLYYYGESGAINESISDMLASLVEIMVNNSSSNVYNGLNVNEWLISDLNGNGIRDLSAPASFNQPDTYNGNNWASTTSTFDNGGVHINSGVGNFWFYLLANGGTGMNDNGDNYNITPIPNFMTVLPHIVLNSYNYMSGHPTYQDFRNATIYAATILYNNCAITQKVINAWDAVGVGPPNEGCQSILLGIESDQTQYCTGYSETFQNAFVNAPGYNYSWKLNGVNVSMPITMPSAGISTLTLIAENTSTGNFVISNLDLYISDCDSIDSHKGIWYFGNQIGFDFSSGIAMPTNYPYSNFETTTAYSDNGEIVYYVSTTPNFTLDYEMELLDKNHNVITNLNPVWASSTQIGATAVNPDLTGGSKYANLFVNASYGSLANGPPNCAGLYRILIDVADPANPIFVSMSPVPAPSGLLADGNGAYCSGESTTIIPGCNTHIYWIITSNASSGVETSVFKLDYSLSTGSSQGTLTHEYDLSGQYGYGKAIAPNGEFITIRNKLYRFDRETGTISFLADFPPGVFSYFGAFSPNSQFYYTMHDGNIYQYDVLSSDFQLSQTFVGIAPEITAGLPIYLKSPHAIGPDGKIYISFIGQTAGYDTSVYSGVYEAMIGVINEPNHKAINGAVSYNPNGYYFPQGAANGGYLSFPTFRDANLVNEELLTIDHTQENCNSFTFMAPACKSFYSWSFGDGDSLNLSTEYQVAHTYANSGTYVLSLSSNVNGSDTTVYKTINVEIIDSVEIIAPDFVCDSPFSIVHGTPGYASYSWSVQSGSATIQNPNSESTGVTWNTAGQNILQLIVTNLEGCSKTVTKSINSQPPVPNDFIADTTLACLPYMPQVPTATDKCGNTIIGVSTIPLPITVAGPTTLTWEYIDIDGAYISQTQNIVIHQIDNGIAQNGNVLTAFQSNYVTYQWIDCETGDSIPGATNQNFVADIGGTYAVLLISGDCVEQSPCIEIVGLSNGHSLDLNQVNIYPNPTKNILKIDYEQSVKYKIYDMNGKLVQTGKNKKVYIGDFESGTYYIIIYNQFEESIHSERIVKL